MSPSRLGAPLALMSWRQQESGEAEEALAELARSLAEALAVSLAEWEEFLRRAERGDSLLQEESGTRAKVLLSLARSLQEWGEETEGLQPSLRPGPALPLAYALGSSYALLALGISETDFLLSPYQLGVLLDEDCAAFIKSNGQEEALRLLR